MARREHSEKELTGKLTARFEQAELVYEVLGQLKQDGLQSDHRFADAYIHHRIEKGYGPLRISQELKEKGIGVELVDELLTSRDADWSEYINKVREKKFGPEKPDSYNERVKQSRFLQYRGFSGDQIRALLNDDE